VVRCTFSPARAWRPAAVTPLARTLGRTNKTSSASMPLKPPSEDIESRRPVWQALSDLFLDTDTSLSREWRVRELAKSPYSIEELEEILVTEVYPACRGNLLSIAGEWAGFDMEWLGGKIQSRANSSLKVLHAFNIGRLTVHASPEWRATKRAVQASRAESQHGAA
jgi:hypothetical protein